MHKIPYHKNENNQLAIYFMVWRKISIGVKPGIEGCIGIESGLGSHAIYNLLPDDALLVVLFPTGLPLV